MLTGDRVSVLQDVQSSRMEGGDVRTTVRMDSMGMSCSLKDGQDGKCYVYFTKIKKNHLPPRL